LIEKNNYKNIKKYTIKNEIYIYILNIRKKYYD
jgi:hypothetical protein